MRFKKKSNKQNLAKCNQNLTKVSKILHNILKVIKEIVLHFLVPLPSKIEI